MHKGHGRLGIPKPTVALVARFVSGEDLADEMLGALPAQRGITLAMLAPHAGRAHLADVAAHVAQRGLDHEPFHAMPIAGADALPMSRVLGCTHRSLSPDGVITPY